MSEHKIPIPSMIYNAAVGGHVTNSQQIIDENENKEQSQINAEVKQNLSQGGSVDTRINQAKNDIIEGASSNGNTLKKLENRISPIESVVGTGGNIDTRIKKAVNVEKTRAEEKESTLNNKIDTEKNRAEKAEENLDRKIDTLETIVGQGDSINSRISNAVTEETTRAQNVESTLQTNINVEITRAQTAEEQLRTLYNNLQQSQPIPVTELPITGEAGKIYRLAGVTSYADYMYAEDALTIPIKMAEYDNAIDDKPTAGSNNLVKSGGVDELISKIYGVKEKEYQVSINAGDVIFEFPVKIPNGHTVTLTAKTENAVINIFRVYVNKIDTLHPIMADANSTVQYTAKEDVTKLILYVSNTTAAGSLTFTTDYNIDFSLENAFRQIGAIPNKVVESEYDTFGVFKKENDISVNTGLRNITIPIPKIEAGQSVRLISKGSAVITTYRIYGNVSGEQNSKIDSVNDEVIYTPSVDVTSLILYIDNCTTAGNIEITLLNKNSVEGEAKYANERINAIADCYGKTLNLAFEPGCFMFNDGSYYETSSYKCSSLLMQVNAGDTFAIVTDAGVNVAVVVAYDAHNNYLKEYSINGTNGYTKIQYVVPQGVRKLRFSLSSSDDYVPFVTQVFKARTNVIDSINTDIYQKEKAKLINGQPLLLDGKNDHKTNWVIEANFRGLTGFTNILVGKGLNEDLPHGGMWLNIKPYSVIPTYSNGEYQGVDHGLTITDYLDVRIESFVDKTDESESAAGSGDATYIRYTLFDGNKQFTLDKVFFIGSEEPFVQVNGTSSAKVNLYYWCTDLKNDLWCYGDSYFSIAQTRWPYWILTRGYSALFNAMPGANSEFMWKRFCYDLMCGNPRKVFWCLGMNDTDNGAINASWLKYLTQIIDICTMRGIEVVLATIPNTPTMDNSYKNAYIKTLDKPYVDFASAVLNKDGTGWIDGMMENSVHPNKKGAKCLANAAMKLFISYK